MTQEHRNNREEKKRNALMEEILNDAESIKSAEIEDEICSDSESSIHLDFSRLIDPELVEYEQENASRDMLAALMAETKQ